MLPKQSVLFLCTGNSCRSQMAEGWARRLHGERIEPHSAGIDPGRLDPRAAQVMSECGVDLSAQHSKPLSELADVRFDLVVTVCAHADALCPRFPGSARVVHRAFDDPPRLAADAPTDAAALAPYRRVRDEIRAFIAQLPELLAEGER